ncbi:hypothetical protein PYCCODRAFT_1398222 [Trametes coccinea BRFM310]|uniref:Transmembrane protein n=1 Tax=Trametes coccinea (strain BRFM310) TaxID=1353009 RepID=A0A1Y2I9N8_TRAC3|nr:hypothetical protein PYCCODRAFT_1398222 [Trametes coccinea BRFM310]
MPVNAQQGHTSNLRSGNPNAAMHKAGQGGGSPRTMLFGMAAVAVGLYGFWRLQFVKQNRSHTSSDPGEMPTWQFRHAQQAPEFNERMSTPGGTGTNLLGSREGGRRGLESAGANERGGESNAPAGDDGTVKAKGGDGEVRRDRGVVGSIMTALHGHPSQGTQNENGHVGQPAPVRRLNDRGGIYTKNSDYKDGYRRD